MSASLRRFILLGISAFTLLVSLLMAEVVVRFVEPQNRIVPFTDWVNGISALKPGVHGWHVWPGLWRVYISSNNQRFRSRRNYFFEPGPKVLRIACLGDSFTFGWGAGDNETYPNQLETILQEKIGGQDIGKYETIEVLNAGYPGTGTGEQALGYDLWVKNFKPHIVILGVHFSDVENDLLDRPFFILQKDGFAQPKPYEELPKPKPVHQFSRRLANSIPLYGYLAQHSDLFVLARTAFSKIILPSGRVDGVAFVPGRFVSSDPGENFYKKGLPLLRAEIHWLAERVKNNDSKLVIVFLPSRELLYSLNDPSEIGVLRRSEMILGALKKVAKKEQVAFYDVTPDLRIQTNRHSQLLYYSGSNTHPNPLGYRAFAESVAIFLWQRENLATGISPVSKNTTYRHAAKVRTR